MVLLDCMWPTIGCPCQGRPFPHNRTRTTPAGGRGQDEERNPNVCSSQWVCRLRGQCVLPSRFPRLWHSGKFLLPGNLCSGWVCPVYWGEGCGTFLTLSHWSTCLLGRKVRAALTVWNPAWLSVPTQTEFPQSDPLKQPAKPCSLQPHSSPKGKL